VAQNVECACTASKQGALVGSRGRDPEGALCVLYTVSFEGTGGQGGARGARRGRCGEVAGSIKEHTNQHCVVLRRLERAGQCSGTRR